MKEKKQKEYSASESTTPFRLYETGFDSKTFSLNYSDLCVDNSLLLFLYIDTKWVLQNEVYILYTVTAFYDNVPTN